ncbi:hypothetical protein [Herbidospora sp. NBRC 101105]|uniref:hypothetical protein n=1 Tax=Herbidospora sp. NBRC 101105 TaxID=3032195 RepID=UPI0025549D7B|nr:hypothetical protein [Herbidospora sp. NBRC 101105]
MTRDPTPRRAGSAVPKFVAVAATPGVPLVIAAVMVASTKLGNRLKPHVYPRLRSAGARWRRSGAAHVGPVGSAALIAVVFGVMLPRAAARMR